MNSLHEEILSLKRLVDQLCLGSSVASEAGAASSSSAANSCAATGAFGMYCGGLSEKLTLFDLQFQRRQPPCLEHVVSTLDAHLTQMQEKAAEAAAESDSKASSFSLTIFVSYYKDWRENLKKSQIAISTLGVNAKPIEPQPRRDPNNPKQLNPNLVTFETLAGAQQEIRTLRNGLIRPVIFPLLFTARERGVLMYGPPGSGKTKLMQALVWQLRQHAYVFMPKPDQMLGRYVGDTEKNIVALYTAATELLDAKRKRKYEGRTFAEPPQHAVIFIDEGESLLGEGRENDASKQRSVNTFLQQMDGGTSDKRITTIVATNFPQTIDRAVLRRMTLKVFVDMPDRAARRQVMEKLLHERYSWPDERGIDDYKDNWLSNIFEFRDKGVPQGKQDSAFVEEDVELLVNLTGPKPSVKHLVSRGDDSEFNDDNFHELGVSLADLTSAINTACNQAASRALDISGGTFQNVKRPDGKEYYVFVPTSKDLSDEEKDRNQFIQDAHASKIVSFDLRYSDLYDSLKSLLTSVKRDEYEQLVEWGKGEHK